MYIELPEQVACPFMIYPDYTNTVSSSPTADITSINEDYEYND